MQTDKGFVLIIVLILLAALSLLIILNVEGSALEERMSVNLSRFTQSQQVAIAGIEKSYIDLQKGFHDCDVLPMTSSEVLGRSNDWWNSNVTCHGHLEKQNYQYVMAHWQDDPCAILFGKQGVQFWQLTSRASPTQGYGSTSIMQATVVIPALLPSNCEGKARHLDGAWQGWRYLIQH